MDVLGSIVSLWLKQIEHARADKAEKFDKLADRVKRYYGTDHTFLYMEAGIDPEHGDAGETGFMDGKSSPYYKATINKTFQWVATMLPWLHNRAPHRLAQPRRLDLSHLLGEPQQQMGMGPTPQAQQARRDEVQGSLMEHVLNYTCSDATFDLRSEGREAVKESLITGRGVMWHEMIDGPGGALPGSFYEPVANLLLDPDAEQLKFCGWAVRKRRRSVWQVAKEFGLDPEELRGKHKKWWEQRNSETESQPMVLDDADMRGDIVIYYEVYSRVGLGQRFSGASEEVKEVADILNNVGDHVFLVICPGVNYPLNLPPESGTGEHAADEVMARLQWPIKTYGDPLDPWPFTVLDYYPDGLWPTPPLAAALSLQAFLDHAYSYCMGRIKVSCRDIILVSKALQEEVQNAINSGSDQIVVPVDGSPNEILDKLVAVLEFPAIKQDLWKIIAAIERNFEDMTGLTALMQGGTGPTQPRSASEVQIRQQNLAIRPNDLADCVEAWMSTLCRKEAIALRLYVGPETVAPILGEIISPESPVPGQLTQAWGYLVNTDDPYQAAAEFTYTIEAGTGRRPNKQKQLQDISETAQYLLPILMQVWQVTGNPAPLNAWIRQWGDAQEVPTAEFMVPPPPMQQPGQPPPQQGAPPQ